jgi:hypothetical protein
MTPARRGISSACYATERAMLTGVVMSVGFNDVGEICVSNNDEASE